MDLESFGPTTYYGDISSYDGFVTTSYEQEDILTPEKDV